ncbi:coiled coil protein [Legionella beliardensis]|uniref:Coiled coil protein n=1 Tax=Legionella beliardensis TaxID=91822 RepID=A0A378I329_9GAMM|nr:hypothetical protein [Legionella beliardensis]STX29342.1 coiled coil protein [Legionella beliardensis]
MEIELTPLTDSSLSTQEKTVSKAAQESVLLSNTEGKQVELTAAALDNWLTELSKDDPTFEEILLSRNGLQNSSQVIAFLHTPAGETVRELAQEELIEIAEQEDALREKIMEKQAERHHLLAYILHKLTYKYQERYQEFCERVQEQIDKLLHHNQEEEKAHHTEDPIELLGLLEFAESLEHKVQDELATKSAEQEKIQQELDKIAEYGETIDNRYEKNLEPGANELDELSEKLLAADNAQEAIKGQINELESKLDKQTDEISQLIANNEDKKAMELLHEHNKLHLQVAGLKDMLAVVNEEKKLFDKDGKETDSFKEAAFILKPDQRVVIQNNKYYLVTGTQLTEDNKLQAEAKFNKLKPEILAVKSLVQENKKEEKAFHGKRLEAATERNKTLQDEVSALNNKLNQLQVTKANIAAQLKEANPNLKLTNTMQHAKPTISRSSARQLENFLSEALDSEIKQITMKEQLQAQKNNNNKTSAPTPFATTPKP